MGWLHCLPLTRVVTVTLHPVAHPDWIPVYVFLTVVFGAVLVLCAPALLGLADADYLVVLTPFAQWLPALAVIVALRAGRSTEKLGTAWAARPVTRQTLRTSLLITGAVLAVPVLQIGFGIVTGIVEWRPAPDALTTALWIAPFAVIALLSAAGEEFGWRGFLWSRMRASRGFWATALTVGVIWSAWHLPLLVAYGMQGDLEWRVVLASSVNLVVASLVLGLGRELSGSAWPAAWGHALLNSALVYAAANLVAPDAALDDGTFWAYTALGWAAWVGIAVAVAAVARRRTSVSRADQHPVGRSA